MQIDVDSIDTWAPSLGQQLSDLIPSDLISKFRSAAPEFLSDARQLTISESIQEVVVSRCADWVRSATVIAYHGTRLGEDEQQSVRHSGIRRLDPTARAAFLADRLSQHGDWQARQHDLPSLLKKFGNGEFGCREGQVHLSVSRTCMLRSSNHYLIEGSEFDGNIARMLFGMDGQRLLQVGRQPMLVKVAVPGSSALEAANPFGWATPLPNLVRELLNLWAYNLYDGDYRPSYGDIDCGLMFNHDLPPEWIVDLESIDEAELLEFYHPPIRE